MIIGEPLEKVIDWIGEILAMLTIILVVVLFANDKWGFITGHKLDILSVVRNIAIVAVLGLKSLEFALKRNVFLAIPFIAVIVVAFVFVFIPLF